MTAPRPVSPFSDHFSGVASGYSAYRPGYPDALFDELATLVHNNRAHAFENNSGQNAGSKFDHTTMVWDCAAGNGQASIPLGDRFRNVLATDASVSQLAQAPYHPNVRYAGARAEHCPVRDASVSLITVAQALHWFQFDAFYAEAKRVLAAGGIVAAWSYGLLRADDHAAIETAVDVFTEQTLSGWWPAERRFVDERYTTIPFPFARIGIPAQHMTAVWTRAQLVGYLRTWSAVSRYRQANGVDPTLEFEHLLADVWGEAERITLRWPLSVLVGQVR